MRRYVPLFLHFRITADSPVKLIKKEQELEYYKELQQKANTESKKEFKRLLESNDFKDEAQLERTVRELDKSIRKARTKDVGGPEIDDEEDQPAFPLLDIPDEELDEAGLKQKRHQKLMKSNHDARARAKAEKEKQKARLAEEERLDQERRENDLEGWLQERRVAREVRCPAMEGVSRLCLCRCYLSALSSVSHLGHSDSLLTEWRTGPFTED